MTWVLLAAAGLRWDHTVETFHQPEWAMVRDISGSMSGYSASAKLWEDSINQMAEKKGFRLRKIDFAREANEFQKGVGGPFEIGTAFNPLVNFFWNLKRKPEAIFIFTDGRSTLDSGSWIERGWPSPVFPTIPIADSPLSFGIEAAEWVLDDSSLNKVRLFWRSNSVGLDGKGSVQCGEESIPIHFQATPPYSPGHLRNDLVSLSKANHEKTCLLIAKNSTGFDSIAIPPKNKNQLHSQTELTIDRFSLSGKMGLELLKKSDHAPKIVLPKSFEKTDQDWRLLVRSNKIDKGQAPTFLKIRFGNGSSAQAENGDQEILFTGQAQVQGAIPLGIAMPNFLRLSDGGIITWKLPQWKPGDLIWVEEGRRRGTILGPDKISGNWKLLLPDIWALLFPQEAPDTWKQNWKSLLNFSMQWYVEKNAPPQLKPRYPLHEKCTAVFNISGLPGPIGSPFHIHYGSRIDSVYSDSLGNADWSLQNPLPGPFEIDLKGEGKTLATFQTVVPSQEELENHYKFPDVENLEKLAMSSGGALLKIPDNWEALIPGMSSDAILEQKEISVQFPPLAWGCFLGGLFLVLGWIVRGRWSVGSSATA